MRCGSSTPTGISQMHAKESHRPASAAQSFLLTKMCEPKRRCDCSHTTQSLMHGKQIGTAVRTFECMGILLTHASCHPMAQHQPAPQRPPLRTTSDIPAPFLRGSCCEAVGRTGPCGQETAATHAWQTGCTCLQSCVHEVGPRCTIFSPLKMHACKRTAATHACPPEHFVWQSSTHSLRQHACSPHTRTLMHPRPVKMSGQRSAPCTLSNAWVQLGAWIHA